MNLLTKAVLRLDAGELEQAERLIERAAAFPYDDFQECSAGIRGADQLLYNLISDELENTAEDDSTWLTVVLDVYARLEDGPGRASLESAMHVIWGTVRRRRRTSDEPSSDRCSTSYVRSARATARPDF